MSLTLPPEFINQLVNAVTPPHEECPLCGMTHAYIAMAQGDVKSAWACNAGAPFFFIAGLVNGGAALIFAVVACLKRCRTKG